MSKLENGDTIILAGSVPKSLQRDIYERIIRFLSDKEIRVVADAENELLLNVLKYRPFLIKPNVHELADIFGKTPETDDEIIHYAQKLKEMGAQNVLVSMAEAGAILLDSNNSVHRSGVCSGIVRNSVGSGDSMIAGFLAGISQDNYNYALRLGTAAGGATAFSDGLAVGEEIQRLMKQL